MKSSSHLTVGNGPPCRERSHIPPYAFSLWDWINAVCISQKSDFFTLYPTRAVWYVCATRRMIQHATQWLVKNGWLVVSKAPHRGIGGAGTYRVVRHAEWVQRHGFKKCIKHAYDDAGEQIS
jgi:hypothetical protein